MLLLWKFHLTFIDESSDFTFIYSLKNKNDAFAMFKVFVTEAKNQSNKRIKRVHSYRETKYDYVALNEFYNSKGK